VWRVCCSYVGRIWDVHDGWAYLLSKAASQATQAWNIFKPIEILFWLVEKVQNGGLQGSCHSNCKKLP